MINSLLKDWLAKRDRLILPVPEQTKAWKKANRKMEWEISIAEFDEIKPPPRLTLEEKKDGFIGFVLCYGFGDDGAGNSDSVLSAKNAWEYACKLRRRKTWQCEYIDFNRSDDIRLWPGAPARSKGFYYIRFQPGGKYLSLTVSQLRKKLIEDTGCGPEGFQFLTITHSHFQDMMNTRKIPFMALSDFDVAPHGFNDFYDAPQLFCSNDTLGLGIGNVDGNYPLFGIPTMRL
ncbi:MAG: hypothetical protein Q8O72_05585 [Bacteroidales bacterium]|nr:hypothetical protein [Bacteroidales bacterium]